MLMGSLCAFFLGANAVLPGEVELGLLESLYVPSPTDSYTTMTAEVPPVVLDIPGTEVYWNVNADEFIVFMDGQEVDDLITMIDDRGYPSFEGDFDAEGPRVYGSVLPGSSGTSYSVELTVPNDLPRLFDVDNADGQTPIVREAKKCDCTDGIDLACNTNKCNDEASCGIATDSMCKWMVINLPGS